MENKVISKPEKIKGIKKQKFIKFLFNYKILLIWFFIFLVSFLMLSPGIGVESYMFINSVDKQIKRIFPKEKFVLDSKDPIFESVVLNSIRKSYIADALSTINFYNQEEIQKISEYEEYAENWFEQKWRKNIDEKLDIDLYEVGQDLIKFDKAVATQFHSYGYVHAGIQWVFKDFNGIFSKEMYENALNQQTILPQEDYDEMIESEGPGLGGIEIISSIGSDLANNKVWFLNKQIDSVKFALNAIPGHSVFIDKTLKSEDLPEYSKISDLYHPNFTSALSNLKAGIIINFLSYFLLIGFAIDFTILKLKNKSQKKEK